MQLSQGPWQSEPTFAILIALYRPHLGPLARNYSNGKKWPKNGRGCRPHRPMGEKWPKNGKMAILGKFSIIWSFLPGNLPIFTVGPTSVFRGPKWGLYRAIRIASLLHAKQQSSTPPPLGFLSSAASSNDQNPTMQITKALQR